MEIKTMSEMLKTSSNQIDELKRKAEDLQKRIRETERARGNLLKHLKTPEAYEAWLVAEQIIHVRMDVNVGRNVIWWLVKVDTTTATLVLSDTATREGDPHCPCMCCHEDMGFSPYGVESVGDEQEEYRHPSRGFRKEWADWLVSVCETLKCDRLEVYGADNAQIAQSVTPLPLEWSTYRDYEELERLAMPPWLCIHKK